MSVGGERNGHSRPESEAHEIGRKLLADWEASQPTNFFSADLNLQRSLELYLGREAYAQVAGRLYAFGETLARQVDPLVREANLASNLPRLERYDRFSRRVEEVIFHPSHHQAGRRIYASGLLSLCAEPGSNLLAQAFFYLSSHNGEAGHNCPLACSAGLIKLLQAVGGQRLAGRYLPGLLAADYDANLKAAQYLTEVQGGSDVGANSCRARPLDAAAGTWLLEGEKWFCSNVTADLAVVSARVAGQGQGTAGLGAFLLPRRLEDGRLNNLFIRQLKDKLGTRSLATGELEFQNALVYQIGPSAEGFKNVMRHVINTSRIYNAFGCCGIARRAYLVAHGYARYRTAFGRAIQHYPLVQASLANMRADSAAMLAGSLHISSLLDELERGETGEEGVQVLRLALNLNKYRSAVLAREVVMQAIEILGGNGTIESFSVLPRLLRDIVVYENWEGTHNVLLAQTQRDMRRFGGHGPLLEAMRQSFEASGISELRDPGLVETSQTAAEIEEVLAMDELTGSLYFRPLMERLTHLYYAACLAVEAGWELREKADRTKQRLALLFFQRRALGRQPKEIAYYDDQVGRLAQ
ncbi:MAG: acyl-CoA dehydrogenase family protein [Candidatus Promineifilaceae bacterium]